MFRGRGRGRARGQAAAPRTVVAANKQQHVTVDERFSRVTRNAARQRAMAVQQSGAAARQAVVMARRTNVRGAAARMNVRAASRAALRGGMRGGVVSKKMPNPLGAFKARMAARGRGKARASRARGVKGAVRGRGSAMGARGAVRGRGRGKPKAVPVSVDKLDAELDTYMAQAK